MEFPSWKKSLIYGFAGIGVILSLVLVSGLLVNVEDNPSNSDNSTDGNNFIQRYDFSQKYQKGDGVRVFYSSDVENSTVQSFVDAYSSPNETQKADFYLRKDLNDRYTIAGTTIYRSTDELPTGYDINAERWATVYSQQAFNNQTLIYKILTPRGEVLKTFISN